MTIAHEARYAAPGSGRSADLGHTLAEPAQGFGHPNEVLRADELTREQKRAVLAGWASDAWAVESAPWLRHCPGGDRPVRLADVLAALRALDGEPPEEPQPGAPLRRVRYARFRPLSRHVPRRLGRMH